jgi:hypothetical protein
MAELSGLVRESDPPPDFQQEMAELRRLVQERPPVVQPQLDFQQEVAELRRLIQESSERSLVINYKTVHYDCGHRPGQ